MSSAVIPSESDASPLSRLELASGSTSSEGGPGDALATRERADLSNSVKAPAVRRPIADRMTMVLTTSLRFLLR